MYTASHCQSWSSSRNGRKDTCLGVCVIFILQLTLFNNSFTCQPDFPMNSDMIFLPFSFFWYVVFSAYTVPWGTHFSLCVFFLDSIVFCFFPFTFLLCLLLKWDFLCGFFPLLPPYFCILLTVTFVFIFSLSSCLNNIVCLSTHLLLLFISPYVVSGLNPKELL